jgi:glutathione S-transferase
MLTLVSYPGLFGLADNNPYGLKSFAFLKLSGLDFEHMHVLDAKDAPRGQLPYLIDDGDMVGDSDAIVAYLTQRYDLAMDAALTPEQRRTDLMARRTLDDLYWVMSYSRWKDPHFWPRFRDALAAALPDVGPKALEAARDYNFQRYHFQGIGRFEPEEVYARGLADLAVLDELLARPGFVFGPAPSSLDAAIYGFVANIHFYDIATPLKAFVDAHPNLAHHCEAVHAKVGGAA